MGWMAMRRMVGLAGLVAMVAGGALACDAPDGAAGMRAEMVGWINESRRGNGLPALRSSAALEKSATGHACDMAKRGYFGHEGPGGPSFTARLRKAGYRFSAANENIAKVQTSGVSAAAQVWRKSAPHWANILDRDVREVGIGVAMGRDGRVYWVMNAGAK